MAPELAESGGVSPLIDVYALGVTLFQMLTGQLPYEADTPMGVMMAHMSKPIPNVRAFQIGLPLEVQAVIERVMAKDPMDRYPTAGEVAADLKAAATTGPVRRPMGRDGAPSTTSDAATVDVLDELPLDDIDAAAIAAPVPRPAIARPQAPPTPVPWPTPPEPRPLAPARPYADRRHDWMAYIALVLGIISLCAWLLPVCGGTISVAGIILGALGIAKSRQRTVSIAGLVLSILGLLGSIIYLILTVVIGVASAGY